jgi:PEP-CTERM motif
MHKMIRSALVAAIAGCALALGAGGTSAAPLCSTITTIGDWAQADGGCDIGDKNWELNSTSTSLLPTATISFTLVGDVYAMQVTGFDTSTAAGTWNINYTISVLDPAFHLSDMFAGADNPGGGSLLTKDVTGDPGGAFLLTVANGVENAASEKHGLTAASLTIDENFSVNSSSTLLSVSDTFIQGRTILVPEPATLLLLAIGMLGAGWIGRRGKRA